MTAPGAHRRLDQLTGEWVLVSPQRTARPWQGQVEDTSPAPRPDHDPDCYLCPGNTRAAGAVTPAYPSTFVFDNDFAALLPAPAGPGPGPDGLLVAEPVRGICRVVCFDPRHNVTLSGLEIPALRRVVNTWAAQTTELGSLPWVRHVQIFENRGAMMGASNPHPHGQIWAEDKIPGLPAKEIDRQRAYATTGGCLLCDYLSTELRAGRRIVCHNDEYVAVVPYWAVWPYETLVLPRRHGGALPDLDDAGREGFADILHRLTSGYDRLFGVEFPYSMGLHQQPTDGSPHPELHLHAHFYPPLLRSATIRKFMVGYELLAGPQRDITAEDAAERLRAVMKNR
ncbi:UDP-glucose--hexose-1-phosphate uridylyltransferase [Actinoplanes friuliensis]|uniref:Galactose-1-phosphate uridylyltransferase n=1 Tax=Actinoplanes friuliensis DSM 7358 TaxID=1246995 RepID=U5VWW0_9ACTN|nr:UDP-glucose--hexose-1-phosphate uridylyltransferase [Actinoplanes friuliensis]AGZ41277.1 galactose-1-phosphate uridylyltransferase [Actinoplanes friuliensis DSM 7358]